MNTLKNAPQILGNALYKGQKLRSIFYFTSLSLLQNTPNPLFLLCQKYSALILLIDSTLSDFAENFKKTN